MRKFKVNKFGDVEFEIDGNHSLVIHAADEGICLDVYNPDKDPDGPVWSFHTLFDDITVPEED